MKCLPELTFCIAIVGTAFSALDCGASLPELVPPYRTAMPELMQTGDRTEMQTCRQNWNLPGIGANHSNDRGDRVFSKVLSMRLARPRTCVLSTLPPDGPFAVRLWPDKAPNGDETFEVSEAKITVHLPKNGGGSAIIICPGGGYGGLVTGAEGHGIAQWLNSHGIAGVVLEYRLPAGRSFVPLLDAQKAIRIVRARATEWQINPSQIGIMGFSAGGHLASTAATQFDAGNPDATDPLNRPSSRPDFAVLVYPVVTMGEKTHGGSRTNLLGSNPSQELIDRFSAEKQVTDSTPPMFLTHAIDDTAVPSANSEALYEALQAAKIPSKYLELPSGGHGLNGYKGPMWDAWQKQSLEWLVEQQLILVPDAKK